MDTNQDDSLALMLGGGGARGAYQAGVLRGIAHRFPQLTFPILSGISAGAVNTIHIAAHPGPLEKCADDLIDLWLALAPERVYDVRSGPLMWNAFNWLFPPILGGFGGEGVARRAAALGGGGGGGGGSRCAAWSRPIPCANTSRA